MLRIIVVVQQDMSTTTSPNSPSPLHILRGHTSPVNSIKFTSCGSFLLSGTSEGEIKIWNIQTRRNVHSIKRPNGIVKLHELDGSTIVSHETSGNISVWSVGQSTLALIGEWNPYFISNIESPPSSPLWNSTPVPVAKSAVDPDTHMIAVAADHRDSDYAQIDVVDIRQRRFVQSLKDSDNLGLCLNMMFIRNAGLPLMVCGAFENGSMRWWDWRMPNRSLSNVSCQAHSEPVLCFDIDATFCGISGGADTKLSVFKFDTEQVSCLQSIDLPNSGIADVKIRGDKRLFVSAGWDHRIRVYSWKKKHTAPPLPLATLRFHSESVSCVDFPASPIGGKFLLAAGSKDKRISLWDVYND